MARKRCRPLEVMQRSFWHLMSTHLRTQENIQKSFKGARCSVIAIMAQIHHSEHAKVAYKFENELQDWIDNQQLMLPVLILISCS